MPSPRRFDHEVVHHLVVQLVERVAAASRRASRSALIVFSRDWMFSAWMSGPG